MKTNFMVFVAALCAVVLFSSTSAFAAGTAAGTVIKNVASMTYADTSGASFPTLYSDTVSTTVEQIAGVTLTAGSLQYSSDSMYVYFFHTITNTGNGKDIFTLSSADNSTLNWGETVFPDLDNDGAFDAADTASSISATDSIAADGTFRIMIRLFVPDLTVSNTEDTIRTTATSQYVDPGPNALPTASAWTRDTIITAVPEIDVNKSGDNASPTPGETITYTITYSNDGTGYATGASLVDTLSEYVTYSSHTLNSGGGTVQYLTSPNRIVWSNIGTGGLIDSTGSGSLTVVVTVNSGVPAGTNIINRAHLSFTDSLSGRPKKPYGGPYISVVDGDGDWNLKISAIGNSFTTNNDDDSVIVSRPIFYKLQLVNNGNRTDTATFTRTSSLSLSWQLFRDVDESGTLSVGDTEFNLSTDSVIVAQNDSVFFVAVDTIAQNQADRGFDSAYYHVSSATLAASDSGYHNTTIKAPVMTLSKSVSALNGRARPGDTLMYRILYTNTGSAPAHSVVISDLTPTGTTYVPGSIQVQNSVRTDSTNATFRSDGSDGDEAQESSGTVTINLGNVGPQLLNEPTYTGFIRFKVRINSN